VREFILRELRNEGVQVFALEFYPSRLVQIVVAALTVIQWSFIFLVLVRPTAVMKLLPEAITNFVERNQITMLIGAFFGGNVLKSICSSSGAFEIYVGRQLAFSGLLSGRMPHFEDIVDVVRVVREN